MVQSPERDCEIPSIHAAFLRIFPAELLLSSEMHIRL
jgi:hypothetical protein